MTTAHWSERLVTLGACSDSIKWARTVATPEQAWETCERGDWLLWIAGKYDVDRRLLVRAACACARTAIEDRPRLAIETAGAWVHGEATIERVRVAAYGAAAATAAAAAATAAADALAAARAAAADAAYEAAYDAAWDAAVRAHADLVRGVIRFHDLRARRP